MPADHRPTVAQIHLDRLIANYRQAADLAAGKTVMAVVKADAYGHGAVPVAKALQKFGCRWFAVATLAEAVELREAGISGEMLLMGAVFPGDEEEAIRAGVTCTIYDADAAERVNRAALRLGEIASVHLKVDTGMSRLGFEVDGFAAFVRGLSSFSGLAVRGLYSHLADADKPDGVITEEQGSLLRSAHRALVESLGGVGHLHLGASAALLLRRPVPGDLVRPGVMLYGGYPLHAELTTVRLEPVMEFHSALVQLRRVVAGRRVGYSGTWAPTRDSLVGIAPVGYADGVPRVLSNRGEVLVGGRRVPIVGRVCMDWIILDLTDVAAPQVGQTVTLIGRQGEAAVTAEDWSAWAHTIPYEVMTSIGNSRTPRVYLGAELEEAG